MKEKNSITVGIQLTSADIQNLTASLNGLEDSFLVDFINKVLKRADYAVLRMEDVIDKIKKANPYCQQHK